MVGGPERQFSKSGCEESPILIGCSFSVGAHFGIRSGNPLDKTSIGPRAVCRTGLSSSKTILYSPLVPSPGLPGQERKFLKLVLSAMQRPLPWPLVWQAAKASVVADLLSGWTSQPGTDCVFRFRC